MSKPRLPITIPGHILKGMLSDKEQPKRLFDMAGMAAYCGTTRQRVGYLYRQHKKGELKNRHFPTPSYYYVNASKGNEEFPLFTQEQVESYKAYLDFVEKVEKAYEGRQDE